MNVLEELVPYYTGKKKAEDKGFISNIDFFKNQTKVDKTFGRIEIDEIGFVFNMPKNSNGITIYTDSIHKLKKKNMRM